VSRDDLVHDVRAALSAPKAVAEKLGLKVGEARETYVIVACPVHDEKTPSCSLHRRGGTLAVRCWGCGWTGDVLHLIAAVEQLDVRREFKAVLARACELAGMPEQADALREGKPPPAPRVRPQAPEAEPERDYPLPLEVTRFWAACLPVTEDPEVAALLAGRGIDPAAVAGADAARALHPETHHADVPPWARFRGRAPAARAWNVSGHRLILPVYDSDGGMRSVRAWLVRAEDGVPKRVPPRGYRASQLVAANSPAVAMLRGQERPGRVVVVEGEPDTLARSTLSPSDAVIGVMSGSWHDGFAARVPYGAEVIIRTHLDPAGDRYADEIARSVASRARVRRLQRQEAA
jgi:hypothetical protein